METENAAGAGTPSGDQKSVDDEGPENTNATLLAQAPRLARDEGVARKAMTNVPRQPPRIVSAAELLSLNLPPREMMLAPVLPAKGLVMLYGPRGLGKTLVALGIAWAVATGGVFLEWKAPRARRVLYVDGEMPQEVMQERVAQLAAGGNLRPAEGMLRLQLADMQDGPMPDLGTREGQAEFERNWGEPPDLLVLDNLSCLVGAARDNEADSWSAMQAWGLSLRRRGVSLLIIHHAGKSGQQRGTSRREDILDTTIKLEKPDGYSPRDGARFNVHLDKHRGVYGDEAEPFQAALTTDANGTRWIVTDLSDSQLDHAAALFDRGEPVRQVAKTLGVGKSTAGRLLKKVVEKGLLTTPRSSEGRASRRPIA